MTNPLDSDFKADLQGQNGFLPFASSQADLAGIRVTRAQFSRMVGVSKQAVTDWVKSGRIILGADGRFDPRQAVGRLLATGDPARLRAKVLAPLVADVAGRDRRIADLEAQVADLHDDAEFHEQSAAGLAAIQGWLDTALELGAAGAGELSDYLPALAKDEEGAPE